MSSPDGEKEKENNLGLKLTIRGSSKTVVQWSIRLVGPLAASRVASLAFGG